MSRNRITRNSSKPLKRCCHRENTYLLLQHPRVMQNHVGGLISRLELPVSNIPFYDITRLLCLSSDTGVIRVLSWASRAISVSDAHMFELFTTIYKLRDSKCEGSANTIVVRKQLWCWLRGAESKVHVCCQSYSFKSLKWRLWVVRVFIGIQRTSAGCSSAADPGNELFFWRLCT